MRSSVNAGEIAGKYDFLTKEEKLFVPSSKHPSSSTARALKQMVISLEQQRIVNYFVTMMGKITEIIEQEVKLENCCSPSLPLSPSESSDILYIDRISY